MRPTPLKIIRALIKALIPLSVVAGLVAFVLYALFFYTSDRSTACQDSAIGRQFDIAVHVVRQWGGREGTSYTGCAQDIRSGTK